MINYVKKVKEKSIKFMKTKMLYVKSDIYLVTSFILKSLDSLFARLKWKFTFDGVSSRPRVSPRVSIETHSFQTSHRIGS